MDRNLFHISYEGGVLEDPWYEPHEDMFRLSVSPEKAPDTPTVLEINYENGDPVAVNGEMKFTVKTMPKGLSSSMLSD